MGRLFKKSPVSLQKTDSDRDFIKYSEKKSEEILFVLHPSLYRYLGACIFCVLTFWAIIPLIVLLILYYYNKSTKYIVTNERIRIIKGLLMRKVVDMELYRVKDISQVIPLYLKIVNLGSIELITSDPSNPFLTLEAISNINQLEESIRFHVERRRDEKKVQEIDQYRYEQK